MKIVQVIPYFCFGGAETMCENLCYALKKMGQEVVVVSLYAEHTPISDRMEQAGIRIRYLDKKLGLDISMVPKLTKVFREEKPDVVHTHLDVIKYAVAAAKLAGVKRCVHTVHSVAHKEAEGRAQKIINSVYYKLGWSVPVALSPEVQETIVAFYGLNRQNVPVIYNGADLSRCLPKEQYSLSEPIQILHVGRFDVPKNHAGLLKAFQMLRKKNPACQLHLVGDGELRPQIEQLTRELDLLDSVVFHGMQAQVQPYLQAADIFVLPSLYEGIPMTIIEAMGTGLPIVASEVGGIPDLVHNGETALLIPCETDAIWKACLTLIEDTALRKKLGTNAKRASEKFSADHMAAEYCKIYKQ
ncbi:MAG: glycosyltransferase [Oscillospiraceae bacterium]|nr:glycosyltransferase [Oscillospiraceae bacterium]